MRLVMNFDYVKVCMQEKKKKMYSLIPKQIDNQRLGFSVIDNGIVLPRLRQSNPTFGLGGVIDNDNVFVEKSKHYGSNFQLDNNDNIGLLFGGGYDYNKSDLSYEDCIGIYLGPVVNQFGHFICDFTTRFWFINKLPQDLKKQYFKFIVLVEYGSNAESYEFIRPIREFMSLIGLNDSNLILISKPKKFFKIVIPDESYLQNKAYHYEYLEIFDVVRVKSNLTKNNLNFKTYDKLFFSRFSDDFQNQNDSYEFKEFGEKAIALIFKKLGFKIINPAELSLIERIYLLDHCKYFASITGTNHYNLIFSSTIKEVICLNKTCFLNPMLKDIVYMRGLCNNIYYVDSYYQLVPTSMGSGPFLISFTDELKAFILKLFNYNINKINDNNELILNYLSSVDYNLAKKSRCLINPNLCGYFPADLLVEFICNFNQIIFSEFKMVALIGFSQDEVFDWLNIHHKFSKFRIVSFYDDAANNRLCEALRVNNKPLFECVGKDMKFLRRYLYKYSRLKKFDFIFINRSIMATQRKYFDDLLGSLSDYTSSPENYCVVNNLNSVYFE